MQLSSRGRPRGCGKDRQVLPNERLPTLVSLAIANQVHPRTMSRALRRLRPLGYVTYRQGYGYFVSHTPPGYE
jgi:DNA-binding transcriptional regulator YhcF (GntR family)